MTKKTEKRTKKPEDEDAPPVFSVVPPDGSLGDPLFRPTRVALKLDVPCPTCGTNKTANRCDVCGHQEHDS